MYYVVKIKEYKTLKTDVISLEETDTLEKAKALRDAMRAIYPDEKYEVLVVVEQFNVLSTTLNCLLFLLRDANQTQLNIIGDIAIT